MKYALIPVLEELDEFMEHQSSDVDDFVFDMGCDTGMRNEALALLHKIYHTNRGNSHE